MGDVMNRFVVFWKDIAVAELILAKEVKYQPNYEGYKLASKQGMIIGQVAQAADFLPNWIRNRVPEDEKDFAKYLEETGGILETDEFCFKMM